MAGWTINPQSLFNQQVILTAMYQKYKRVDVFFTELGSDCLYL